VRETTLATECPQTLTEQELFLATSTGIEPASFDKLRMTSDKLRMTSDKLRMTSDKLKMTRSRPLPSGAGQSLLVPFFRVFESGLSLRIPASFAESVRHPRLRNREARIGDGICEPKADFTHK
jgi:hypothetical protein